MANIVGGVTSINNPRTNWAQTDKTKADFLKNKPSVAPAIKGTASGEAIAITDASPIEHEMGVKVWGKNLLNRNTARADNGTLTFDGNRQTFTSADGRGDLYYEIGDYKDFVGKTLTISYTFVEHQGKYNSFYTFIQADGVELTKADKCDSTTKQFKLTYTIPENATAKKLRIRQYVGYMFEKAGDYVTIENLQVEIGDTVTDYAPYVDIGAVKVKKYGKNLLNRNAAKADNGTLTFDGNRQTFTSADGRGDLYYEIGDYKDFVGKTITVSYAIVDRQGWNASFSTYFYADDTELTKTGKTTLTYTIPENATAKKLRIRQYVGYMFEKAGDYVTIENLQVEIGDKVTGWEDYKESVTYTPNTDGTVEGVTSLSPVTTLMTDTAGAIIEAEYNKDTNKVIESLVNAIISLGGNV